MKRNFLILLSGGIMAQGITFATLPVISRLYTPESFGYLAGAMSIASICGATLHGRYHMAIPIAQRTEDPIGLFWLSLLLTFTLTTPVVLVAAYFADNDWNGSDRFFFLVTCLLLAIGTALIDIFNYWLSYRDRFRIMAQTQSLRSLVTAVAQIVLSPFRGFGLAIGALLGIFATLGTVTFTQIRRDIRMLTWPGLFVLKEIAVRYRHFPLYGTSQGFIASASWNLLPIALLQTHGAAFAGLYWAAYRVLIAPLALFNGSYRQVTLRAISQMSQEDSLRMQRTHTAALAVIGISVILVLFFLSDFIFGSVLGPGWEGAGQIAVALSFGIAADLFKVPAICFEQSRHEQKRIMIWEGSIFLMRYLPTMALVFHGESLLGVAAFSILGLVGWTFFCLNTFVLRPIRKAK